MTERGGVRATPYAAAEAARLGVDLASVTGTGVGGRIRPADVRAAAPSAAAAAASVAPTGDGYRRNPLVDDLARRNPAVYSAASAEGPPPTLFVSGDLPPFCASGLDPAELLKVPWRARHALAAAPTIAAAYAIMDRSPGRTERRKRPSRTATTRA